MREHVIGDHKIGLPSVLCQSKSDLLAKEFFYDFDTLRAGGKGCLMCRLHAVARYPALTHELANTRHSLRPPPRLIVVQGRSASRRYQHNGWRAAANCWKSN